jgi:hypothetical protein
LVQQVVEELGLEVVIDQVQVRDQSEAAAQGFLGSPSVQIDGKDIEPARRQDVPNFACRLYNYEGRRTGVPPKDMIVRAIQEARGSER